MSLEVKVGPPQLAIHQGHAVLLSEPDGQINWPSEKGLYCYDARVVSSWTVYANGEPWDLLNSGTTTCVAARVFLQTATSTPRRVRSRSTHSAWCSAVTLTAACMRIST
jgi:N-terminal domain of (some) glycogen debranching enzymes